MPTVFLNHEDLIRRRKVTDKIALQLRESLDLGALSRASAKTMLLNLRRMSRLDDDETEGLIARLDLGDA